MNWVRKLARKRKSKIISMNILSSFISISHVSDFSKKLLEFSSCFESHFKDEDAKKAAIDAVIDQLQKLKTESVGPK